MTTHDDSHERDRMVEQQLAARGITDERVLQAFRDVPRAAFVPAELVEFAYADMPLPIGDDQTISQPYIVALTVAALDIQPDDRVLEIGTGSGYAAAILGRLAKEVYTVERIAALAAGARTRLAELGYDNVHVTCDDGTMGWAAHAPYTAIAVAAGAPDVPPALIDQLAIGGRLVIPVGPEAAQVLMRCVRVGPTEVRREPLSEVRFVPLIGRQGWSSPKRLT